MASIANSIAVVVLVAAPVVHIEFCIAWKYVRKGNS